MPVAATFAYEDEDDESSSADSSSSSMEPAAAAGSGLGGLAKVARLDTLVTVVDGQRFMSDVLAAESLQERQLQADEEDERTVADLLVEQVGHSGYLTRSGTGQLVYSQRCMHLQHVNHLTAMLYQVGDACGCRTMLFNM
jgi:G3E family GTPase